MFTISEISVGGGLIGICPIPGRFNSYLKDFKLVHAWRPDIVLTLTDFLEFKTTKAEAFPDDLKKANIEWLHFPIIDYGIPDESCNSWNEIAEQIHKSLNIGGRILCHCAAGCGRSGMVVLRLMCELGEAGDEALARLRKIRECAVETLAQKGWAEKVGLSKL